MKIIPAIITVSNYVEVVRVVREEAGVNLAKELELNNISSNDPRATCHLIGLCEKFDIDEVALDMLHFGFLVTGTVTEITTLSTVLHGSVQPGRAIFSDSVRNWKLHLHKLSKMGEKEFVTFVTNYLCNIGLRKFFSA